jgi:hypothetical protein
MQLLIAQIQTGPPSKSLNGFGFKLGIAAFKERPKKDVSGWEMFPIRRKLWHIHLFFETT